MTRITIFLLLFTFACSQPKETPSEEVILEVEFLGEGPGGHPQGRIIELRVFADGTAQSECLSNYPAPGDREMSVRLPLDEPTLTEIKALTGSADFLSAASIYTREINPIDYFTTTTIRSGTKSVAIEDYSGLPRDAARIPKPVARLIELAEPLGRHLCSQLPEVE